MKTQWMTVALAALTLSAPAWAQTPIYPAYPGPVPPGLQPSFAPQPTPSAPAAATLPEGVGSLYALEGTNTLLAWATPDGYDHLRELVRNIDGQLDIVQTQVAAVDLSADDLHALGVSPPGPGRVADGDAAKLVAALGSGRVMARNSARLITRENTPIDAFLRPRDARLSGGGSPLSLVPRVARDGSISLELLQPLSAMIAVRAGQTVVLAIPGDTADRTRLLFLTPTIRR